MKNRLYVLREEDDQLYHWYVYSCAGVFLRCSCCGFPTEEQALQDMKAQLG